MINCRRCAVMQWKSWALLFVGILCCRAAADEGRTAEQVIRASGIEAGLCVHLGTTDGALEAGLTNGGRMLVQGLALSAEDAATARQNLFDQGLYGIATVSRVGSLKTIPFCERTVNLLVADLDVLGGKSPPPGEIERVLGYEGVAYLKQDGKWAKTVKPTPKQIDQWTHFRHGADRHEVSNDLIAGPPNMVRWIGGLSLKTASSGPRTSDGVYVQYSGLAGSPGGLFASAADRKQYLWARDVNSGVLLWHREIAVEAPTADTPGWGDPWLSDLLVATSGRVYTYDLSEGSTKWALTAYDIRTGDVEKVFDHSVVIPRETDRWGRTAVSLETKRAIARGTIAVEAGKIIQLYDGTFYVMDSGSGDVLWKKSPTAHTEYRYVLAGDGMLIALRAKEELVSDVRGMHIAFYPEALEAYRLVDGKSLWTFDDFRPDMEVMNDLYGMCDGRLPLAGLPRDSRAEANMVLLDAREGKVLWKRPIRMSRNYIHHRQRHPIIIGNELWDFPGASTSNAVSYDLVTGEERRSASCGRNRGCMGHCATVKYLIMQKSFQVLDDTDPESGRLKYFAQRCFNPWCGQLLSPSYGSVFCGLSVCPCEAFVPGSAQAFYAVTPITPVPDDRRLDKASGTKALGALPEQTAQRSAVATFECSNPAGLHFVIRRFPRRRPESGRSPFENTRGLGWHGYSQTATTPVEAGDLTLVAHVHEHRLTASRDGEQVWNFVAGGRITEPPVVHQKLALFGCHDGYVYAVNLRDGSLVWRFLAAPTDRRHVIFGQVESAWPVFNVALYEGQAYFVAGRHAALDGGLHIYCVDPAKGSVAWHVKRRRGLSTDTLTPYGMRDPATQGKTGKDMEPGNTYELADPIEVRDGRMYVRGYYRIGKRPPENVELRRSPTAELVLVEDVNNPQDVIINPETLTPPGMEQAN